jgi:ribosomal-protein-alanine N-acetyltransferase
MLQPICLENEQVYIHPLRPEDISRYEHLVKEIFQIMSDDETLHFIPEKRLGSLQEAENWLNGAILNFHCGRNYLHFISDKVTGRLLGMVDIVTPEKAKEYYLLDSYPYFIEFYLKGKARGRKIMSGILPLIIDELQERSISFIAAVINSRNLAAQKVISKAGFEYQSRFDARQDLYLLALNGENIILQAG